MKKQVKSKINNKLKVRIAINVESDLAEWVEKEAKKHFLPASTFLRLLLRERMNAPQAE